MHHVRHLLAGGAARLRPAAGVLGLFTFMQTWNEFMWPLAVLQPDNPTVQLSISNLANAYFKDYTLMFAGTSVAILPLLVVFIISAARSSAESWKVL